MKKLIKELEKLSRVSPSLTEWGEGYIPGVMDALQIVKSHNPWHDVTELPQKYDTYLVVTEGNCIDMAHFAMIWSDGQMTSGRPIKWTYLPEQPK